MRIRKQTRFEFYDRAYLLAWRMRSPYFQNTHGLQKKRQHGLARSEEEMARTQGSR